jgi:copper homeostasis protein
MQYVTLPIHVLIRPRGGDFVYDRIEMAVIRREIENCKAMGCEGIVIGALDDDGDIDPRLLEQWVQWASPMEVTFHRAFALTRDPMESLHIIAEAGCNRVLTSGCAPTCEQGLDMLAKLVEAAPNGLDIQAGSGVSPDNIPLLHAAGVRHYHMSARETVESNVTSELFAMDYQHSSLEEIKRAVSVIKALRVNE